MQSTCLDDWQGGAETAFTETDIVHALRPQLGRRAAVVVLAELVQIAAE
jgi:hypothetical protein